jgi:hypothetical protein
MNEEKDKEDFMSFENYVENHLTLIRIVEIESSCKIDLGEVVADKDDSENEFSMVGVNPLYFRCELCNEELDDEENADIVKEHYEKHKKA